jgi:hypothetical protein
MKKRNGFMPRSAKKLILSLFIFTLALSASAASAHKFILTPDRFDVPVGGSAGISSTFTEIVGESEISIAGLTGMLAEFGLPPAAMSFDVRYEDGSLFVIPNNDLVPATQAYDRTSFTVEKPGTVVVQGKLAADMGSESVVSHIKTFLNLAGGRMAQEPLGGGDVLEVVFAEGVPAGGVKVRDKLRFKFLFKGEPLKNAPVFASYTGAPTYTIKEGESDVEVNDYLEAVTDENGIATFKPDCAAGWFVGAFDTTTAIAYGGGILFQVSEGAASAEEMAVTEELIGANDNKAGVELGIVPAFTDLIKSAYGWAWADTFTSGPRGSTSLVTGEENQIPGNTGAKVEIPFDLTSALFRGLIGVEQPAVLTPDALGEGTYNALAGFVRKEYADGSDRIFVGEDGSDYYIPYSPDQLLPQFGISIMCRFSDGAVRDATESFQLGILCDEQNLASGKINLVFGTMLSDSGAENGSYWKDLSSELSRMGIDMDPKISVVYDGKKDDKIEFSYWLAKKAESGGSSGGCDTGTAGSFAFGLLALGLPASALGIRKKRG